MAYGIAVATLIAAESGSGTDDARRILDLIGRYRFLAPVDPNGSTPRPSGWTTSPGVGGRLNYVLPTTVRSVEVVPELADHRITRGMDALVGHPLLAWPTA